MLTDVEAKKAAEDLRKRQRLIDGDIDDAIRDLYLTRRGQRLIWWLLQTGRVNEQPFVGGREATDFNCGQLNVGLQLQARFIEASPEGYLVMQRTEYNDRRNDTRSLGDTSGLDDGDANGAGAHVDGLDD